MDDDERLNQANRRCEQVLSSTLAQSKDVLTAGQQIVAQSDATTGSPLRIDFRPASAGLDAVATAAVLARVFTLTKEPIFYAKVIRSLRTMVTDPRYDEIFDGLDERWAMVPVARSTTFVQRADGAGLPADGVTDACIADRVLYADIVHADDAAAILNHISDEQRSWALTAMAVDWVCLVAQTQHLMLLIRPDLVPSLTPWTGDSTSLFERWGSSWVDVGSGAGS